MVDTPHPFNAAEVGSPNGGNSNNVFTEFISSAWRSGVQRPVESVGQIVGVKTDHVETDDHLQGLMKMANLAGNATGQLADLALLSLAVGKIPGLAKTSASAGVLDGLTARSLAVNGTTGFIYGSVLTPVEPGQSQLSRLGNGVVDAGTFMTLGAATSKIASKMGGGLLAGAVADLGDGTGAKAARIAAGIGDRAIINVGAGAAAGASNVQLDAWTHGKAVASPGDYVNGIGGWAIANGVFGETGHQLANATAFGAGAWRGEPVVQHAVEPTGEVTDQTAAPAAAAEHADQPAEHAATNDAATAPAERTKPELDLRSMKEIAQTGDIDRVRKLVNLYYPALKKAFPLPGEIEDPETYVKYLMDGTMTWDMEQLLGPIQGGLQYQVLPVGGEKINNAGWLEHIWVADHVREGGYGSRLLEHVQDSVQNKGGDVTFWEWNNPDKMTREEIEEDEKGGITTQDRVAYWGKRGASVAVIPSTGEIAPYAQPGMDGQEEVPYLSLAWSKPGGLEGQTISKGDYLKTLLAAHGTITDVDADPTVAKYKAALEALPDQEFKFVRLDDYIKQRTETMQTNPWADEARINRWQGNDFTPLTPRKMFDIEDAPANPEVAKALEYQAKSRSPWLRTADMQKRFPTLQGDIDADTVVVGSGVVGQQIADRLSALGQRVVVLERHRAVSGASDLMGAMNTFVPDTGFEAMADKYGDRFPEIMRRSIAARAQSARLGRLYGDYQPVDSFNVGYSDNNEAIAHEARIAQQFDPSVRFVTGGDAEKIFPLARSAAIFPGEGNLNPRKMLLGMASSGRYSVYEDSPVIGVSPSRTGIGADIFTPGGTVHAKKVIFATNQPVTPFSFLNDHLTPVQCFANVADIGMKLPGNFFDAPDAADGPVPFSYWRQFGLPGFKPDETLVGGTARFLDKDTAVPYEPQLPIVTRRLFNAEGRDQSTAVIFTSYADGVPIYAVHPQFPAMSIATGGGGTGLVGGALLADAAAMEAAGRTDELLSPSRFNN